MVHPNLGGSSTGAGWQGDVGGVSDPSDWSGGSFHVLRDLDASLRCEICSDLFRAPVAIKTCSHIFCSQCIRDYINQPTAPGASSERPCPNCRQPKVYDSELVPIPQLEGAAEAWRKARPEMARKDAEERQRLAVEAAETAEGQDRVATSKKRKSSTSPSRVVKSSQPNGSVAANDGSRRVTRGSTRLSQATPTRRDSPTDGLESDDAIVIDDHSDEEWKPETANGGRATQSPSKSTSSSSKSYKDVSASDLAECPICSHTFTLLALNRHLDSNGCKGPDGPPPTDKERGLTGRSLANGSTTGSGGFGGWFQKPSSNSSSSSTSNNRPNGNSLASATKLKRPQYHLLAESKLRKLCEESNLPTSGHRTTLESRHRRWVDLFNANLDAAVQYRKSEGQMRREMRDWEREREREEARKERASGSSTSSGGGAGGKGKSSATPGYNGPLAAGATQQQRKAYTVSQSDHFKELVAQGRRNLVVQGHTAEGSASKPQRTEPEMMMTTMMMMEEEEQPQPNGSLSTDPTQAQAQAQSQAQAQAQLNGELEAGVGSDMPTLETS